MYTSLNEQSNLNINLKNDFGKKVIRDFFFKGIEPMNIFDFRAIIAIEIVISNVWTKDGKFFFSKHVHI